MKNLVGGPAKKVSKEEEDLQNQIKRLNGELVMKEKQHAIRQHDFLSKATSIDKEIKDMS